MGRFWGITQLFIIAFLFTVNSFAGGAIVGKISIIKGQVFIVRGANKIVATKDLTILETDSIVAEIGTARITMIDSNLVDIYPKSKVEIAKYVYKPNEDQKNVELKVDFGKIKSTVNQKYDGAKNTFQVKTPSAVAGVRGTVFTAEYDPVKKVSAVVTIEGLVAVAKILDREKSAPPVFVKPNQIVNINNEATSEKAQEEQPRDLKPEEREKRQKQDSDLGYAYDTKKQILKEYVNQLKEFKEEKREIASEGPAAQPPVPAPLNSAAEPTLERPLPTLERSLPTAEAPNQVEQVRAIEKPVVQVEQVKITEPGTALKEVKEIKQEFKEEFRETSFGKNQEYQQKQVEGKQQQSQKRLEDEQVKKQKQAEEAQFRREEELKRSQEDAQRKAELARRLAEEMAKRAEEIEKKIPVRPPAGEESTTLPPITNTTSQGTPPK